MFNFRESDSVDYIEVSNSRKNSPSIDYGDWISMSSHKSGYSKGPSFNEYMRTIVIEDLPEEDRRLDNWWRWLEMRKRVHARLGAALDRKPPSLIMNSIEDEKYIREEKDMLELARVYVKPDKFRGNPYFWQTPIFLSNKGNPDLPDCALTLSKLEKGIVNPIEYVDTPKGIRKEKDVYGKTSRVKAKESWDKSDYLRQKRRILRSNLKHIEKFKPMLETLVIEGKSVAKTLEVAKRSGSLPVLTVSECAELIEVEEDASMSSMQLGEEYDSNRSVRLKIQGTVFFWKTSTSKHTKKRGSVLVCEGEQDFKFVFKARVNEKSCQMLKFENLGTVKFSYWWKPIRNFNYSMPLLSLTLSNSRFFFNKNDGLILPGQTVEISVWFHSRTRGVFQEIWELIVEPRMTEEFNTISFRFWGLSDDVYIVSPECNKIEAYLQSRQQESEARRVMQDVLKRIRRPDPPLKKGYGELYMDEKHFLESNPGYFYHPTVVETLRQLYNDVIQDSKRVWDFNLKCLRQLILRNNRDPRKRNEQLDIFCTNVRTLLSPCPVSYQRNFKLSAVRNILCDFANNLEAEAEQLKSQYAFVMSLPTPAIPAVTRPDKSDTIVTKSIERIHSRRLNSLDKIKSRRKLSENRSKGMLVTAKQAGDGGKISLSKSRSQIKATKSQSKIAVVGSVDSKKYAEYREALFVKVYHHLGTAVEQVSAVLDSLKTVE